MFCIHFYTFRNPKLVAPIKDPNGFLGGISEPDNASNCYLMSLITLNLCLKKMSVLLFLSASRVVSVRTLKNHFLVSCELQIDVCSGFIFN